MQHLPSQGQLMWLESSIGLWYNLSSELIRNTTETWSRGQELGTEDSYSLEGYLHLAVWQKCNTKELVSQFEAQTHCDRQLRQLVLILQAQNLLNCITQNHNFLDMPISTAKLDLHMWSEREKESAFAVDLSVD